MEDRDEMGHQVPRRGTQDGGPQECAALAARPTPPGVVRKIVRLRLRRRLGPVQIADALGMAASTGHAVLSRRRLNRLSHLDRVTGERIRRYEHEHSGDLIHFGVAKLGEVPECGGRRYVSRQ